MNLSVPPARVEDLRMKNIIRFLRAEKGIAAIEMAFIMPFMLLIYFGMMDVTGLISFNRRVTAAASTVGDLVSAQRTNILLSQIADFYNGAYMITQPTVAADVRLEVYGYRLVGGAPTQIWKTTNANGTACTGNIDTSNMATLMASGNDLVVSRACIIYTPYLATFLGTSILGAASFNVAQTIMLRPRSTPTLTCYQTVINGAVCT
jgi:Flp pilus assembly protein TadG